MKATAFPALTGKLTPATINSWISRCEDIVEAHQALNPTATIAPSTMILLAGLRMEEPEAHGWWSENRDELKKLGSWETFTTRVRDRFIPSNWRLDALAVFYTLKQGKDDFRAYAAALQDARNALISAGKSWAIHDTVFKNHLLFFAHPVLQLRVRANPALNYADIKVDGLIALMASTWDSLVAERVLGHTVAAPSRSPAPLPSTLPELTVDEKQRLRASKGCFNCRLSPGDAKYAPHPDMNCPGDPSRNIPPRVRRIPTATVASVATTPLEHTIASIRFVDTDVPITFTDMDDSTPASPAAASLVPLSTGEDDDWSDSDDGIGRFLGDY